MSEPKKVYSIDKCVIDIYLQKSKKFLFPLLKIDPKSPFQPDETYLSWRGEINRSDHMLLCVYELQETAEFKLFEKTGLFSNEYFSDFRRAEENLGIYIFSLAKHKDDILHFMQGKYSQFSSSHKKVLKDFYSKNAYSKQYIDSFVNPDQYFEVYAKLLDVDVALLRQVGELINPPDFIKEQFTIKALNPLAII